MSLDNRVDLRNRTKRYLDANGISVRDDEVMNDMIDAEYEAMITRMLNYNGADLLGLTASSGTFTADTEVITWTTFGVTQPRWPVMFEDITEEDTPLKISVGAITSVTSFVREKTIMAGYTLTLYDSSLRVFPKLSTAATIRVYSVADITDLTDSGSIAIPVSYRNLLCMKVAESMAAIVGMEFPATFAYKIRESQKLLDNECFNRNKKTHKIAIQSE